MLVEFGKHKGRNINQVNDEYLQWMLKSFSKTSKWHKAAADALTIKQQEVQDLLNDLKICSTKRDLQWGRKIHAEAVETGNDSSIYVLTALIKMYAKCSSMGDAHQVFDSIQKHNVVSWTALLLGYAENGQGYVSLELFSRMKAEGCVPDSVTYVAALKACTSLAASDFGSEKADGLEIGSSIHMQIGDQLDLYVQNALITMYAKCGSMSDAHQVFQDIRKPDVVSWTALLSGYAENGAGHLSLDLFTRMKAAGCAPDSVTFLAALKACTSLALSGEKAQGLEMGRRIHSEIGDRLNLSMQNTLIDMYGKCGSIVHARHVFNSIQKPDVVSWTALLLGYAENGEGHVALDLFSQMKAAGCAPDSVTHVAALKTCAVIGALALGKKFHSDISEFTVHLVTCLVDFYAKCGSMVEASAVFDLHVQERHTTTWNALLAGYSSCGDTGSVFALLEAMKDEGFRPNSVTFICVLLCCSHAGLVSKAMQYLKAMPVHYGVIPEIGHYNCIVDALGRANRLVEAIFLLREMPCNPNAVTWRILLSACRKWKNAAIGRMAFQALLEMDKEESSVYLLMGYIYGSCGMWEEQERLLQESTEHRILGQAYVADEMGRMVKFIVGEADPPGLAQLLDELSETLY